MAKKHYPVVRSFPLSEPTPSVGSVGRIVDVGRCLSQANRRLYRYGRYYEAKIDLDADSNQVLEVYALRDDWAVQKGFQLAYSQYLKNSSEEMAALGENRIARWSDFRVYHGETAGVPFSGPLFKQSNGATTVELVNQGEFADTQVTIADGTEKRFTWASSGSASQYSILEEYDKVGNAQESPSSSVGSEVAYDDIEQGMDAVQADNLENLGELPPYDQNGVNANGPLVKIATLNSSSPNAQKLSTGYFCAPCGLIVVRLSAPADIRGKYSLTVKGGDYKGVHAPSMLE